jgi:hypothetical protein
MGYSKGRRFTNEQIIEEAKKYKTKREIKALDPGLLSTARKRKIPLSKLFEHMVDVSFSTPQLMCKLILETLLEKKCLYNTRQIIKPYELDIYFEEYKLAIEYNGHYWHQRKDAIERDKIKQDACNKQNITLVNLNMKSRNWENDVKQQIITNLYIINNVTGKNITPENVLSIDCKEIYKNLPPILNLESVKEKISLCKSVREFNDKFQKEYKYLLKSKQLFLLDNLRKVKRYPQTKEEIIELCKKINSYNEFVSKHIRVYNLCIKLNVLKEATKHMKKTRKIYESYSNDELINFIPKNIKNTAQLKKNNAPLYYELFHRNLLDTCGLSLPEKRKLHFARNINYFTENVIPLIEKGFSLNEIAEQQLLPLSSRLLKDIVHVFAGENIKQKILDNKIQNYKNKQKN